MGTGLKLELDADELFHVDWEDEDTGMMDGREEMKWSREENSDVKNGSCQRESRTRTCKHARIHTHTQSMV